MAEQKRYPFALMSPDEMFVIVKCGIGFFNPDPLVLAFGPPARRKENQVVIVPFDYYLDRTEKCEFIYYGTKAECFIFMEQIKRNSI